VQVRGGGDGYAHVVSGTLTMMVDFATCTLMWWMLLCFCGCQLRNGAVSSPPSLRAISEIELVVNEKEVSVRDE
jgi:hypothetical protein